MRKMYKVGDTVVRIMKKNTQIGAELGTHGRILKVDRSDSTYLILLLEGILKGKEVWWFHAYTDLVSSKPNWEV